MKETVAMIVFPASSLAIGIICSLITKNQIKTWYDKLIKPRFVPPNWAFGPVWTILYILIGISGYLIWKDDERFLEGKNYVAWGVYFLQLFLNYSFVFAFFTFHLLLWSVIHNLLLGISIVANIVLFYSINTEAALYLLPYLFWALVSTYFTIQTWRLNGRNSSTTNELQVLNEV